MKDLSILIVGAGVGGLSAAIALRQRGFSVEMIEKDPEWSVYGVGIIQQSNVVRAVAQLGILDRYLDAGFGFSHVDVFAPTGDHVAHLEIPTLADGYPAALGVSRPELQRVLGDAAREEGAKIRLGLTVDKIENLADRVNVVFSDGSTGCYDLIVGADGVFSDMRDRILPEAPKPEFTGQAVWRYNFPRPADIDTLHAYEGETGIGLVPLSDDLMYIYVTTAEPGNPWYERKGLAAAMRAKLGEAPARIRRLAEQITDDDAVVYKPLESVFVTGEWHKGRIVLIGDAVHATTPHLGQGAGMAIEDGIVLAEELATASSVEDALCNYRERRFERCRFIVETSRAICDSQLGKRNVVNTEDATREMFVVTAQPI